MLHGRILVPPLLARALASAGLATYLLNTQLGWAGIVRAAAWYALVDGALGLIEVALLVSQQFGQRLPVLTVMTFADAVIRVALGALLLAVPAIAEVPMTVVPLFAAVGAISTALGVAALIVWTLVHHRFRRAHRRGAEALFDPLSTIGLLSVAVGSLLFFNPPAAPTELRDVLATAGVVLAASFAVAGIGAFVSAWPVAGEPAL